MATMNSGLGGATGYGENSFVTNGPDSGTLDDGSVYVDITSVFGPGGITLFGQNYTGFNVGTNGVIGFDWDSTTYNPEGLEGFNQGPLIAPLWTDMDLSQGGDILWDLDTVNGTVTITWLDVAPSSGAGTNSFQVVLTDTGGGNFDLEFIYEDIQYGDGDTLGNSVGLTDGNGNVYELEGSRDTNDATQYETTSFDSGPAPGHFSTSVVDGTPDVYSIDGTSGADNMDVGYTDADGQHITNQDDYILAGDGNDTIRGGEGDDTIVGGAGDDVIYSGSDSDAAAPTYVQVYNGDNYHGTTGQDFYHWNAETGSNAVIRMNNTPTESGSGDGEADYVVVGTTNNTGTLTIGDFDVGNDRIVLPEAYASISMTNASSPPDYYSDITITYANGNTQSFVIYHDGSTPLTASEVFTTEVPTVTASDNDQLIGGEGDDTFILEDHSGNDTIDGGAGEGDHIDASNLSGPASVTYSGDGAGDIVSGSDTITFSDIEQITLTNQADFFDASAAASGVSLDAGTGDDTIIGSSGNDTLSSGIGHDTITGGLGDDVMTSAGGEDLFVLTTSGGRDTITDFGTGDLDGDGRFNDQLDVSNLSGGTGPGGSVTRNDVVVSDDGSGNAVLTFPDGEQLVLLGVPPTFMSAPANLYSAGIPCFTTGTLIDTATGPRPVETLRVGDLMQTADEGCKPVIWIGMTHVPHKALVANPRLRPITLHPGGSLLLARPMTVSRQHRFVFADPQDRTERFLRANQLLQVAPDQASAGCPLGGVTYVHVLLERHQVLFSGGVATESFFPGPWSLRGLSPRSVAKLAALLPRLRYLHGLPPKLARMATEQIYAPLARDEISTAELRERLRATRLKQSA
jgi:hypothetical protein